MKRLILFTIVFSVLFGSSYICAEQTVLGREPKPSYRADTDLQMSFPLLNEQVWAGGKGSSFEGSLYHFYLNESSDPAAIKRFANLIIWQKTKDDRGNLKDFGLAMFNRLKDKDLAGMQFMEDPKYSQEIQTSVIGNYTFEIGEIQVYTKVKGMPDKKNPDEEKWVAGASFSGVVMSLYDPETTRYLVVLSTANETLSAAVRTVATGIVKNLTFGKKSSAGLVSLLLILIAVLIAGGVFFFLNERKKAQERARRLRNIRDDEDEYDDYDDYDDYDKRGGGRRGSSREPERPSRGRSREPEPRGRSSRAPEPRRPSRGR